MNQQTLRDLQTSLKPIINLIETYQALDPVKIELFTAIKVAISNCIFNTEDCHGYTHENKVRQINNTLTWLKTVKEYESDYHYLVYIINEIDMIIIGHVMSE